MTLRMAADGAPPSMRRMLMRWCSDGLRPSPPLPSGKWTQARPRSNCSPKKAFGSVVAGGWSASNSSTRWSTLSVSVWTIVTAFSSRYPPNPTLAPMSRAWCVGLVAAGAAFSWWEGGLHQYSVAAHWGIAAAIALVLAAAVVSGAGRQAVPAGQWVKGPLGVRRHLAEAPQLTVAVVI